jgi:hypothetical protein
MFASREHEEFASKVIRPIARSEPRSTAMDQSVDGMLAKRKHGTQRS